MSLLGLPLDIRKEIVKLRELIKGITGEDTYHADPAATISAIDSELDTALKWPDIEDYYFHCNLLQISNGTDASTIKCRWFGTPSYNYGNSGPDSGYIDNIAKNSWTSKFSFKSDGTKVYVSTGCTVGTPKLAWGQIAINSIDTTYNVIVYALSNYVNLEIRDGASSLDWSSAVDSGYIQVYCYYFADA